LQSRAALIVHPFINSSWRGMGTAAGQISGTVTSLNNLNTFGIVLKSAGGPRIMQFAVKNTF